MLRAAGVGRPHKNQNEMGYATCVARKQGKKPMCQALSILKFDAKIMKRSPVE